SFSLTLTIGIKISPQNKILCLPAQCITGSVKNGAEF
ncbi:MAG: hypothetical protein ACJA13_002614, partial [Paraglaciecola sp.]